MPARKKPQSRVRTHLAALREERRIGQAQMALAIGVSVSTYRRLERGQMTNPPIGYLANAAIVLDVQLEDVIEDEWRGWHSLDAVGAPEPPDRRKLWRRQRHLLPPD